MDINHDADWLIVRAARLNLQLQRRDATALRLSLWLNAVLIIILGGIVEYLQPMAIVYVVAAFTVIWIATAIFILVTTLWRRRPTGYQTPSYLCKTPRPD